MGLRTLPRKRGLLCTSHPVMLRALVMKEGTGSKNSKDSAHTFFKPHTYSELISGSAVKNCLVWGFFSFFLLLFNFRATLLIHKNGSTLWTHFPNQPSQECFVEVLQKANLKINFFRSFLNVSDEVFALISAFPYFVTQTFLTTVGVIPQETENKGKRNLLAKKPIWCIWQVSSGSVMQRSTVSN